jgi:hypothetical protein
LSALEFTVELLYWIGGAKLAQNFIDKNHYYLSFYYNISKFLFISSGKYLRSAYISPI